MSFCLLVFLSPVLLVWNTNNKQSYLGKTIKLSDNDVTFSCPCQRLTTRDRTSTSRGTELHPRTPVYGLRRTRTCVSLGAQCSRNSISYHGCTKRRQPSKNHFAARITMHNCTDRNTQRPRAQKQRPFGCDHHKFSDRVSLHTCQAPGSSS